MAEALGRVYENLDVRIEKVGDNYRARVSAEAAGEGAANIDLSASLNQLDGFLFNVGQPRRRSRGSAARRLTEAQKYGATLFDAVFQGDALGCLQRSLASASTREVGTRIRLRLTDAPELSDLPWEFLFDSVHKEFFSLSTHTPIVRYLECLQGIRPLKVVPPLRILAVISSPSDWPQLDVEREWTVLRRSLANLIDGGLVELERLESPQFALIPRTLKSPFHILHFIGHGEFTEDGGYLIFEDEWRRGKPIAAERLGTVLRDHKSLRLAVLNACEGARGSLTDPFSGTAQTLVRQGIPAVLAMQFEITDEAAITIASEFYASVAVGEPIDTALADVRRKLFAQSDDGVEWATPVLYLRAPDGQVFDVVKEDKAKRLEAEARAGEEVRIAERARADERARVEAEARASEQERIAKKARADERARAAAEVRANEQARITEKARADERARVDAEARASEQARIVEKARADARIRGEAAEAAQTSENERPANPAIEARDRTNWLQVIAYLFTVPVFFITMAIGVPISQAVQTPGGILFPIIWWGGTALYVYLVRRYYRERL
jgi:hypothetical protein